jgi:hypothetical protein
MTLNSCLNPKSKQNVAALFPEADAEEIRRITRELKKGDVSGVEAYITDLASSKEALRNKLLDKGQPVQNNQIPEADFQQGVEDVRATVIDTLRSFAQSIDDAALLQEAATLQNRPLQVTGTGANGQITNWDIGQAFTDRHMETHGRVLDPSNEDDYQIVRL